ncbi:mitochondrial mitochondrial fission process protein [Andalucia godoyi]|uniref:Mitochondrial fission process protein 1 n=1 Tax=Andalucia godoyi TaxID=505711 RepID=A0A8K0AHR9_ANDGO|nr:mitochondrial mitochondrial fission process protein [Andalucia godoyi]|eukprot:ANDGO_04047.mRNA.1 mitochondrial mitochondrial fission process protein
MSNDSSVSRIENTKGQIPLSNVFRISNFFRDPGFSSSSHPSTPIPLASSALPLHRPPVCSFVSSIAESHREVDLFRETPLRHAGYADEVGEAFRSIVPKSVVYASYGISVLYTIGDVIDKANKESRKIVRASRLSTLRDGSILAEGGISGVDTDLELELDREPEPEPELGMDRNSEDAERSVRVLQRVVDTLVWQCAASFVIPPLCVNRIAALTRWFVHSVPFAVCAKPGVRRWAPVAAGLSIIPALPVFVDPLVDQAMDKWVRPFFNVDNPESGSQE